MQFNRLIWVLLAISTLLGCDRAVAQVPAVGKTAIAPPSSPSSERAGEVRTSTAPAVLRTLGDYTDPRGFRRLYLLVPPGLEDAQIVALARRVHAKEKNAWLWLLDSDEKAAQMMSALPRTAQGDMQGYPGKWVEAHTVAHSSLELMPKGGGKRWALYKGPYTTQKLLGTLPCIDGAGGC